MVGRKAPKTGYQAGLGPPRTGRCRTLRVRAQNPLTCSPSNYRPDERSCMKRRHTQWKMRHIHWTSLCLAALATTACASRQPVDTTPGPSGDRLARLEALYQARVDSVRSNVSEADVRFMTGMIPHHAQALVMSGLAPTHGASAEIRILTARIINAQTDEIALMQRWLRERDRHAPEVVVDGLTLTIDGASPMRMHGMLTDEQMRQLDEARGAEWDRLFLRYMIQHHEGAVTMVTELFSTDGAANDDVAFKVASDIQVDQITEIRRMKIMLEEMAGGPIGPRQLTRPPSSSGNTQREIK